eukprot:1024031-Alexandrium_andersonii.AAC.1
MRRASVWLLARLDVGGYFFDLSPVPDPLRYYRRRARSEHRKPRAQSTQKLDSQSPAACITH